MGLTFQEQSSFQSFPYMKAASELANCLLQAKDVHLAHKPNVTLQSLLPKPKDKVDRQDRSQSTTFPVTTALPIMLVKQGSSWPPDWLNTDVH